MSVVLGVGDVYQMRIYTVQGNQCAINRFNLAVNSTVPSPPTDVELVTQVEAALATLWKAIICTAATYRGMQAQRIFPAPLPVAQSSTAGVGLGGRAGNPLPGNVAGIGKWLTQQAGRRYRGRIYIPFISSGDSAVLNQASVTLQNNIVAWQNAVLPGFTITHAGGGNAGVAPCLFHPDHTVTDITGGGAEPLLASMKRRGGFGRPNSSPI